MTNYEFSNEFDILWNNIMSNQAPGLDAYEKSVFLTQAQEALVLSIYNGEAIESFDVTETTKKSLNVLVTQYSFTKDGNENHKLNPKDSNCITEKSQWVILPSNLYFMVYEEAISFCDDVMMVTPIKHDDLYRIIENPFRGPSNKRVLRLDTSDGTSRRVELISNKPNGISEYRIRYIRKPKPIILEDLIDGVIEGESNETECELPENVHRAILKIAVNIAKTSWV